MNNNFNNYTLSNNEVEKIIKEFMPFIKNASKKLGEYSDECEQRIKIAIFRRLTKNRKK